MNKIKPIFLDTTLRDGHQCPDAAISEDKKYFEIVRGIDGMGFDIMEIGFPSSSTGEFNRVNEVANMVRSGEIGAMVGGLTQMVDFQVERTLKALEPATLNNKAFFHTYFPVDPALREASVGKVSKSKAVENVSKFVKMAYESGMVVQFSPEGYSKVGTDFDFCTELIVAAIESGATYINCPDTIGGEDKYSKQKEYYIQTMNRHKDIIDKLFPGNEVVWSVHNHNDLGTAIENSIEGVLNGPATKIEGTINGIGERAGNADLGIIVTRMKTVLSDIFDVDHINLANIGNLGNKVSDYMLQVQPHYPVTGANAMRHTSGGHTNAILENPEVYQPYSPEIVGKEIELVFGPNSGGNLAMSKIIKAGYKCSENEKREIAQYIKDTMQETGRYKGVSDTELMDIYFQYRKEVEISGYNIEHTDDNGTKTVTFDGKLFGSDDHIGTGETPFIALENLIKIYYPDFEVKDYNSKAISSGSESKAQSTVIITVGETDYVGVGIDKDIESSSLKAMGDAINRAYIENNYRIESE